MSLESQIEKLTAAIEKLNTNMQLLLSTPADQLVKFDEPVTQCEMVKDEPAIVAPVEKPEPTTVNASDVTAMCLSLSRKSADNKNAIRALLDDFGAKKVSDLGDNLAAFAAKLEQL